MKQYSFRLLIPCLALAALAFGPDEKAVRWRMEQADEAHRFHQLNVARLEFGRQPTPEEAAFMQKFNQAKLDPDYTKTHPPRDSVGTTPLTDLAAGKYKGENGGLYGDRRNTPPPGHLRAGLSIAKSIQPLNASGQPDPDGRIVFISIGYSNWTQEFSVFAAHAMQDPERNPKVLVLDCARSGQTNEILAHADAEYYKMVDKRLEQAGVTPAQVQIVMMKVGTQRPTLDFPWEPKYLQSLEVSGVHVLQERFRNLKLLYLTSRIYGGYATMSLNPEPHAFETAFAVKWLIGDQIAGKPELNYNPNKGKVVAPWMAWGPYLWADGVKGRADGLQWNLEDFFVQDRTHPSAKGCQKVAKLVDNFMKSDPTARIWYEKQSASEIRPRKRALDD